MCHVVKMLIGPNRVPPHPVEAAGARTTNDYCYWMPFLVTGIDRRRAWRRQVAMLASSCPPSSFRSDPEVTHRHRNDRRSTPNFEGPRPEHDLVERCDHGPFKLALLGGIGIAHRGEDGPQVVGVAP